METTTIDYERLNEAAQVIHDVAFARGELAGCEKTSSETVEHVGRRMLSLAAEVVELACDLHDPAQRVRAVQIAARIYGRTPGGPGLGRGRIPSHFERVLRERGTLRQRSDIDEAAARELIELLRAEGTGGI